MGADYSGTVIVGVRIPKEEMFRKVEVRGSGCKHKHKAKFCAKCGAPKEVIEVRTECVLDRPIKGEVDEEEEDRDYLDSGTWTGPKSGKEWNVISGTDSQEYFVGVGATSEDSYGGIAWTYSNGGDDVVCMPVRNYDDDMDALVMDLAVCDPDMIDPEEDVAIWCVVSCSY